MILLLDFEKAHDCVNWTFLKDSIKKLGFSQEWIDWIATLYQGGKSLSLSMVKKEHNFISRKVYDKDTHWYPIFICL